MSRQAWITEADATGGTDDITVDAAFEQGYHNHICGRIFCIEEGDLTRALQGRRVMS